MIQQYLMANEIVRAIRPLWMKLLLLMLLALGTSAIAGYRINMSGSLPIGIYRIRHEPPPLERGSVVVVCLSESWTRFALERRILRSGYCQGGGYGIGKVVLAVGGDVVTLSRDQVVVGDSLLINGTTLRRDQLGRDMPHHPWGQHTLQPSELWLYSCHPSAFDSRYFGPVDRKQVRAVVEPILIERGWTRKRCAVGRGNARGETSS